VFNEDNVIWEKVPLGPDGCRFDEKELENQFKAVIEGKLGKGTANDTLADHSVTEEEFLENGDFCPVFVVATEGMDASGAVKLFRSYGYYRDECAIWEAARATTAAPTFFKPIRIKHLDGWFLDGGLKRNNPAEVALEEASKLWPRVRRFCLVSIGTGVQKEVDFIEDMSYDYDDDDNDDNDEPKTIVSSNDKPSVEAEPKTLTARIMNRIRQIIELSTHCEEVHRAVLARANAPDPYDRFPYFRFNVEQGMQKVSLEEWRKRDKITAVTRTYLADPAVGKLMLECLTLLVNPTPTECT
jgi:hypothetical protein